MLLWSAKEGVDMRTCLELIFVCSLTVFGQAPASTAKAAYSASDFTVTPVTLIRNQTTDLIIQSKATDCDAKKILDSVTVKASAGSGVSDPQKNDSRSTSCMYVGKVAVAANASGGRTKLWVKLSSQDTEISLDVDVLDVQAGPIPPGMTPEVDVTWKVLPRRIV